MNKVTLQSDGSIIEDGKPATTEPLIFLSFAIALEQGYSLRSYFLMFEKYPMLTKLNAFFPTYMAQYRSSPKSGCVYAGFDVLEFSKTVEMIGFPGEPRLEIYNSLRGACGKEMCDLRYVQLENLLDMPLKLGKLRHIVFGDKIAQFEFDTVFSLFEFIDGILWELSFQGTLMACELRRR